MVIGFYKKCKNQGVPVEVGGATYLSSYYGTLKESFLQKKFIKNLRNPSCIPSDKNRSIWSFELGCFGAGSSPLNDHPLMMKCLCTSIFQGKT